MFRNLRSIRRVRTVTACAILALPWAAPPAAGAAPIILEVFYDGTGGDSGQVFTEIYGDPGISLNGWSLVGINGSDGTLYRTIDLTSAAFPTDGVLVIAQVSANPPLASVRDFAANVDWQNGPDAVQLLNPLGILVDALQYGDAGVHNAGEGVPAFDAAAGLSLSRDQFGTDTGSNLIDFSVGIPSPGLGPPPALPAPVPEPSTLWLVGGGLVGYASFRRRHARRR